MIAAYVIRRVLSGLLLLFGLTLITFVIYFKIPADPGQYFAGPGATQAQIKAIDKQLGIDEPVIDQYGKFVWGIVRYGDFGSSFGGSSVNHTLATVAPVTLSIVAGGAVVLVLLAFPLALLSARYAQSLLDRAILLVSIFGIALHPFVVGAAARRLRGRPWASCRTGSTARYAGPRPTGCRPRTATRLSRVSCRPAAASTTGRRI